MKCLHNTLSCWKHLVLIIVLLTLTSPKVFCATTEMKLFELSHRMPEEFVATISQLLAGEGTVSALNGHLIVQATPEKMMQVEQLLQQLDVSPKNLTITVERNASRQLSLNDLQASGSVSTSSTPATRVNGNVVYRNRESHGHDFNQFSIKLLENRAGFISAGQTVAFSQQWVQYTQRFARQVQTLVFRDIETGFSVRPRVVGEEIELEITPAIRSLGSMNAVDFDLLSTVVRVRPGEWLDIGALLTQRDEVSRAILSDGQENAELNQRFRVKVDR